MLTKPYWLTEAGFSTEDRKALAKKGQAMPDGSYPVRNLADLAKAVRAFGRAKNPDAVKAWIIKRAKALKATNILPADWPGSTKKTESGKLPEANLSEAERSWQAITSLIQAAAQDEYTKPGISEWCIYVCDVYDDYAVIRVDGDLYSVPWAIDGADVTLGEPTEVIVTYAAASDATGDGDNDGDDGKMAKPGIPADEAQRIVLAGDLAAALVEAGRQLSKGNEAKLRAAIKTMSDHVDKMTGAAAGAGDDDEDGMGESKREAAPLTGDIMPLLEKAVRRDGTVPVKIIQPGWGSSGYYSRQLLERDGPKVFTKGTKMFWDHATEAEEAARPEGSLRNLAAELVGDARWDEDGAAGAGLYADAKVFGGFKEAVEDLAPHIGVSIRASGRGTNGEAEGRKGKLIEELTAAHSIDFVTVPGAGGQVLQLFEAARGGRTGADGERKTKEGQVEVDERAYQLMKESNAKMTEELGRLKEGQMLLVAKQHVREVLEKRYADVLPAVTIERLTETLAKNPPLADGSVDYEGFSAIIHEAAKSEMDYLAQVTGSGRVRGMGSSGEPFQAATDLQESAAQLEGAFARMGLHKDAAKLATAGRN
ncbi:MAG: hypothetical protein ACRDGF_00510 [Chloroflexota bacterium]